MIDRGSGGGSSSNKNKNTNSTKGTTTNNSSVSQQSSYISNSGTGTVNKPTNTSNSSSSSKGTASNNTSVTTPTQVNKKDNADIASQYNVSTNGNETADYSTVSDAIGTSMKNQSATAAQLAAEKAAAEKAAAEKAALVTATPTTEEENNWLEDYYTSLMDRYNAFLEKQQNATDLAYKQQNDSIDASTNRLIRKLLKNSMQQGWDAPVTNIHNVQASGDKAKANLAVERAKADASNAETNYSNYNSLLSSAANSSASDAWKKKFFSNL